MERKFKIWMIVVAAILIATAANAEESVRKFSKSWPVGDVETLEITNKFGQVKVSSTGGNLVTVEVVVTADIKKLADITVEFGKTGKIASAETKMATNFKSRGNFSINYTVNIPDNKNLVINNKFGNVVLGNLKAKGTFDVAYGNFSANELNGPGADGIKLNVEYGKADVETISNGLVTIGYSKFSLGNGNIITLDSKYSGMNLGKLNTLILESKYDSFAIDEINALEGESKFTNYKIGLLTKKLKLESAYGTLRIEKIPVGFELIDVNTSYGQISLGIDPKAAYNINSQCVFCDIIYPLQRFQGNRTNEDNKKSIEGKIAGGSSSKVMITSKFGNIKVVE